jgi:uncharacterized protein (TIGR02246 family)
MTSTLDSDRTAIQELIKQWLAASKAGDVDAVLNLMTDDVVFMVPGREPFGKREFAANSRSMSGVQIDGTGEIVELEVLGDWAWLRNRLRVTITMPGSEPVVRSGYTLTILRKQNGKWELHRDANLLSAQQSR